MDKLWLVKDKHSHISGPYSEDDILQQIEDGVLDGEESIASYPSGRWKSLATHSVFYDKLLKVLNTLSQRDSSFLSEEQEKKVIEPTVIIQKNHSKDSKKSSTSRKKQKIKITSDYEEETENDIIEMEEFQEGFVSQLKEAIRIPVIILSVLVVGFFVYQISKTPSSSTEHRIRLAGPGKKTAPLSSEELKKQKGKAVSYYLKGDIANYLKSQTQLSRLLEGKPDFLEGYQYLCLIHLELWPFAFQDESDRRVLKTVLGKINTLDRGGMYAGFCNGVNDFLNGKYNKASEMADSFANAPGVDKMITYFYYLKSKALKKLNRTSDALVYIRGITQILASWVAPYVLAGEIHYEREEYPAAIKSFQKALSIFPEHSEAGLRLGIIKYKHLKQIEGAEKQLSSFLGRDSNFANPEILKEAYMTMANISLQQQDKSAAQKYAMKAYTFDPSNEEVNVFLTRVGGKKPGKEEVKTRQMIYKGDLLVDQGNCLKAQKFYKQAYEIDEGKNALAAVRMAKCFWKRGISGQAVQWLKKAIAADLKRMESYFLLADYLSQKYSFEEAKDILGMAARQAPNSYEIFKGYALVSFRQKNYNTVVHYGNRALDLYSADIEVHLILSQAYRALGKHNKEFEFGEKAVQANANSTEAQINFAWATSSAYGFSRGEKYFKHLINKFPLTIEYRQSLGEYYFENDKYDKALEIFEPLPEQEPNFKPAYIYLGRIYSLLGTRQQDKEKIKRATKYLLQASLLDPSDPDPLFYMGTAYMGNEQYLEAESQFERVMGINSRYPLIHYYIGKANFLQGGKENLERALEASKTETKKNPNLALGYILTGDIYKTKAKQSKKAFQRKTFYELCVKEYQKALSLRKKDIDLHVQLINCYRGSGELDSALQLAEQVVATHGTSGYPELYRQLGLIYELKGDYEHAQKSYKYYFLLQPGAPDKASIERRLGSYMSKQSSEKIGE